MLGFHDVAVGRINEVAALREFSYKKMIRRFVEVTIITSWPY